MTLFHWDLPYALELLGGLQSAEFPSWFRLYARLCFSRFGQYVKYWITINEPLVIATGKEGDPLRPPCEDPGTCEYKVGHQLLLAHEAAARIFHQHYQRIFGGKIGIALSSNHFIPATSSESDVEAARRQYDFDLGWFAHPLFIGNYPPRMRAIIDSRSKSEGRNLSRLPSFTLAEINDIKGSADFLGLNHYTSTVILDAPNDPSEEHPPSRKADAQTRHKQCVSWPSSGSKWLKSVPWGMRGVLRWIQQAYRNPPVLVTENGWSDTSGTLDDPQRFRN